MRGIACLVAASVLLSVSALAGEKWALVIGVDKCKALGELKVCAADARALKGLLKQAGYEVNLLTDDTDDLTSWPTIGNIKRGIERIAEVAVKGDVILLFFSGHGVTEGDQCHLVPVDGDRKQAIPLAWVKQKLGSSAASHKLLVLDACHAGAAKGVNGIEVSHKTRSDIVMLLSCKAKQVSWPDEQRGHSVFSWYLLEGLRGAAAGPDRKVTHQELFSYVQRNVRKWTFAKEKPLQTPVMAGEAAEETVLVAVPEGGFKVVYTPSSGTAAVASVSLPASLRTAFEIPTASKDQHGNPALKGSGYRGLPKEIWHKQTGMELVLIEPGEFQMGSNDGGFYDQRPVHTVRLTKPFYIGKYEVTQAQWGKATGEQPWHGETWAGKHTSAPANYISWDDCQAFIKKLNSQFGTAGGDLQFALPTEAEWEYACRAGTSTAYCFGDDSSKLGEYAWYKDNAGDAGKNYPQQVGGKKANGWGLHDMHGNVWEWCEDWHGDYPTGGVTDPRGPTGGSSRIYRGGCWDYTAAPCRSAYRDHDPPDYRRLRVGCRLVLRCSF